MIDRPQNDGDKHRNAKTSPTTKWYRKNGFDANKMKQCVNNKVISITNVFMLKHKNI